MVHLVRHGRTEANRVKRVMGWLDEPIEPDQRAAAVAVAGRLVSDTAPDGAVVVLSSPLRRARETAAPLAERWRLTVEVDERLGELRVGRWQGLLEEEVARRYPDQWRTWRTTAHELERADGETLAALYQRVAVWMEELSGAERWSQVGTIVAFTHDAVVRAAVAWTVGAGPASYATIDVANCSITTVRLGDSEHRARLLRSNDTCHLGPGQGTGRDDLVPADADAKG